LTKRKSIAIMPMGRKTGGRQRGTPNKAKVQLDTKLAEVGERVAAGLSPSQIATMAPVDIMLHAMRVEAESANWRMAAAIAEKAAPFIHAKLAPRAEDNGGEASVITVRVTGGLPD
jgi:hypothetical protein